MCSTVTEGDQTKKKEVEVILNLFSFPERTKRLKSVEGIGHSRCWMSDFYDGAQTQLPPHPEGFSGPSGGPTSSAWNQDGGPVEISSRRDVRWSDQHLKQQS